MTLAPKQAQARVDEARAWLRATERARDASFAEWWKADTKENGQHGAIARLAHEVGLAERAETVRQAVKRGRRSA